MTPEERDEESLAAAAALAAREVPFELLRSCPSRTLHCTGLQFKHYRSLARTAKPRSIFCLPVASPLSLGLLCWTIFTNFIDLTYTAFIVALSVGFNHTSTPRHHNWMGVCDWVGSIVYVTDQFLGFQTGVVVTWGGRAVLIRDARTCAWFYMRHGTFLVDFIANIPFLVQLGGLIAGYTSDLLRMVYALRLLRLLRVVRLLRDMAPGSASGPMRPLIALLSPRMILLVNTAFSLAVLVNLLGCLWWNLALDEGLENSWAAYTTQTKEYDLLTASDVDRWLVSCYFALTTMVTIGYGDITPVTIREVELVLVFELVGVAFFGYLLNQVAAALAATGPAARRQQAIKEKLQDVEERMQGLGLPAALKRKIRGFFANRWMPQQGLGSCYELYADLPPKLRVRLLQQRQEASLAHLDFFPPDLPPKQRKAAARTLAAASTPLVLAAGRQLKEAAAMGETPVADGSAGEEGVGPWFYILEEGEMRAVQPGDDVHMQRHVVGGGADFSGPAVVGLSALFSQAANQPASDGSEYETQQNPGLVGVDGAAEQEHGNGTQHSRDSSSRPPRNAADAYAWQQNALALTDCQLWRVDCQQLYTALRQKQPAVLLHLVRRLLAMLELRSSSTQTYRVNEQGVNCLRDEQPQQQQDCKNVVVERLSAVQAELEEAAAAAAAAATANQKERAAGKALGISKLSVAPSNALTSDSSWRADVSAGVELATVTVAGRSGQWGAGAMTDVWHAGDA